MALAILSATQLSRRLLAESYDDDYYSEDDYSDIDDCGSECSFECVQEAKEEVKPPRQNVLSVEIPENMCTICMDDESEELIAIKDCHHKFCRDCLSNYINFKTGDASGLYHEVRLLTYEKKNVIKLDILKTYGVPCPAMKCTHVMLIKELEPVSTENAISQFHRFTKVHEENLIRIEELRQNMMKKAELPCPRCRTMNVAKRGYRGRMRCSKCSSPFCAQCGLKHATHESCEQFQKRLETLFTTQNKAALDLIHKLGLKNCPSCFMITEKVDGCNYMTCRCGQPFCNLCGCPIDNSKHFSHFYEAPFDSKCKGPTDASPLVKK